MSSPLRLLTLCLLFCAACTCGPEAEPDAGAEDAGVDAGAPPEGGVDAGRDAGESPDGGSLPELKIFQVLPPRGGAGGGYRALLKGSGFVRGFATRGSEAARLTSLKFGQNPSLEFQIIDDETLDAKVPPGRAGLTHVTLTNPSGTFVCAGCFTYFDELSLTGVSPAEGPLRGGNEVTLTGAGFTPDVEVLFGGRSSPQVEWLSAAQLRVAAPGGVAAGLVDVVVYNKNGLGLQRRAYQYVADLRVSTVSPLAGPLAGGTSVVLQGQGLLGATAVTFGGVPASSFVVQSATRVTAVSPPGAALGAVDLEVVTPRDRWTVRDGFAYVDASGPFALYGVYPHLGPAAGGNEVTLVGQDLDAGGLTVTIGGQPATLGARTFSTAVVTVPARSGPSPKVTVSASAGATTRSLPQGYTYRLTVSGISPASGPSTGDASATVSGTNFPGNAAVRVGPQLATRQGGASETALAIKTPRGPGGGPSTVWVWEASDPENEAMLANAYTFLEPLLLGRVQPPRGALAGNSLVTVLGAGFGEGTVVTFGPSRAKDVKIVDSHTLTCRTPRGEVGAVDVGVARLSAHDELPGGYSYYDPRSLAGGLSGGQLAGTLNVTVLESTPGFRGLPVPLAQVMLGVDPGTPFQGLTDARGQLTFSDPALVKAQTFTVYKQGFESATVTSVSAENLTVYIGRTGGDGEPGDPAPGVAPSLISGKVTGFKRPRPLQSDEALEARVFVSQESMFYGPPYYFPFSRRGETWQVTAEGGEYLVVSRAGLRATYAVLGIRNATSGAFTPFLMGVRRGVVASPDAPAKDQHIVLDMHLEVTVPVTIDGPVSLPGEAEDGGVGPARNALYAWLDLGPEGFIPHPLNWGTGTASETVVAGTEPSLAFPAFPRLDGANFIFLNKAASAVGTTASYAFRRQPGELSAGITVGPMLPAPVITRPTPDGGFDGTLAWQTPPGPQAQLHELRITRRTQLGPLVVWSVVLPGTESQVALPPPALQLLKDEVAGQTLSLNLVSSRSPKFDYQQWTYDSLSVVSWSSYVTIPGLDFQP